MATDMAVGKEVTKEVADKIREFARITLEEAGLQMTKAPAKYGYKFNLNIEAVAVETGRNGVNLQSVEAQDFLRYAKAYGLEVEDLGNKFVAGGEEYVFTGINTRARAMPFTATRVRDGHKVKFRENAVEVIKTGRGK